MKVIYSFFGVLALILIVFLGVDIARLHFLFGVVIPGAAVLLFIVGIVFRVLKWAHSPVPFRIPTTCGQQKSLPWIKSSRLENPQNTWDVIGRMTLEILFFRSLFRNTRTELRDGPRLAYGTTKYLWLGGLLFHWSFLIILLRHFRFFVEPVPSFVLFLQGIDGFFQIGVPLLYVTDIIIVAALSYLFLRRIIAPKIRYISLPSDYFALFLILGIAITGVLMRYFLKVDLIAVKELVLSILSFHPSVPEGIGLLFYIHFFLVSFLLAYFPVSKLMHMGGVFLSPTRNLSNNSRMRRHVNPWNPPVKVHTYEEWEEEFHDVIKGAGLPLEKE
jgi:[DsrC]-trisulfide reductase subunit M